MPELTLEEYKELRRSGRTAAYINRLGDDNARAELQGYRKGQEAMQRGPSPGEAVAPPEAPYAPQEATSLPPPTTEPHPTSRPAPWYLDALPAAGGMLGGAVGGAGGTAFGLGFGGVPGAIGGSALGTAGGEMARQHIARAMGYDAPQSSGEAAGAIGGAAKSGAIGGALTAAGGRVLGVGANLPFIKRIPGTGIIRGMAQDATETGARIRGLFNRGAPPGAAPALQGTSRAAMQPIVGQAEAEAFRQGGLPAVEALRASGGGGGALSRGVPQGANPVPKGFHLRRETLAKNPVKPKPRGKPKLEVVKGQHPNVTKRIAAANRAGNRAPRRHPAANERAGAEAGARQPLNKELELSIKANQKLDEMGITDPAMRAQALSLLRQELGF